MVNKESFDSIISFDRIFNISLSKKHWIIPVIIFVFVFLFNLPYLFVDMLDHDDGLWYWFASEGKELQNLFWRGRIALLTPLRDWFYSYSMVYLGLPFTRGVFVAIMAFISILLFNLYNKVFGVDTKVAFLSAVIPGILPSLKGIPVGLNASYAMWGLLPILGSLLVLHKAFANKGKQSLFLLIIALLLYATGLNFVESTNFLIPSVLLFFLYYFPNNKLKSTLYAIPFLVLGLFQIYKQSAYTHYQPTTIPFEVVVTRVAEFVEMASFLPINQPYSTYVTLGLSLLGIIGIGFFSHTIINKPDHFKYSSVTYSKLLIFWPLGWIFSNSYAYIFKSPVFRAYDYAYVYNYGAVFLQASGIVFLLSIAFFSISNQGVKKMSLFCVLSLILLFTGAERVKNCTYKEVESYQIIREALLHKNFAPETQLFILNTPITHAGHPEVNSGHIRYILKRKDIHALIGPDRFPNNIFSSYRVWSDRMMGFDPEKPLKGFIRSGDTLKQVNLMLQVLSTGLESCARLSWNLYDIINNQRPVIIASGIGMQSYLDFIENNLPIEYQNDYIAFAPDAYPEFFLNQSAVNDILTIPGIMEERIDFHETISLKNIFVKKTNDQTRLQLFLKVNKIPGGRFKLSYLIDGRQYPVNLWDFAVEDDYILITTPPINPYILQNGFMLGFMDSGSLPRVKLSIDNGEFAGEHEVFLSASNLDQQITKIPMALESKTSLSTCKAWFSIRNMKFYGSFDYFNNMLSWNVYYRNSNGSKKIIAKGLGWDAFENFQNSIKNKELKIKETQFALSGMENENSKYFFSYNLNYHDYLRNIKNILPNERWIFVDFMGFDRSYIEPINHFGHSEWTFNIWINPRLPIPSSEPFYRHYTILEGEDTKSFLGINQTGGFTLYKNVITPENVIRSGWNYLTYSYSIGIMTTFINGITLNEISINNPLVTNKRRRIGQQGSFTHYYVGHMMNAQLWNRALTQSEIQESMFARLNGAEPGLVGYWPMDSVFIENGVKKTPDLSPSQNHGILVGEPVLIKGSDMLFKNNE